MGLSPNLGADKLGVENVFHTENTDENLHAVKDEVLGVVADPDALDLELGGAQGTRALKPDDVLSGLANDGSDKPRLGCLG